MSSGPCRFEVEINGKTCEFYHDLWSKEKLARPIANLIYSIYVSSDMADAMDRAGYRRNSQNQHDAKDVLKFIEYDTWKDEVNNFNDMEVTLGVKDNLGERINYDSAVDALGKAEDINTHNKGFVATVFKHGDQYQIMLKKKTDENQDGVLDARARLAIWDMYKQAFNNAGIDLENVPDQLKDTVNAFNSTLADDLVELGYKRIEDATMHDAMLLFTLNRNQPKVEKWINNAGGVVAAARMIEDANKGNIHLSADEARLAKDAFFEARNFPALDMVDLKEQARLMSHHVIDESPEAKVRDTLHKLKKKYKLDIEEIHKINDEIATLSDAAQEAVFVLQKQLAEIRRNKGDAAKGKHLEGVIKELMHEIAAKQYGAGILKFLKEAAEGAKTIEDTLRNENPQGTELEKTFQRIATAQKLKTIKDMYYDLVSALSNEALGFDQSMSAADIANIRRQATDLRNFFDKMYGTQDPRGRTQGLLGEYTKRLIKSVLKEISGKQFPDEEALNNAVEMAAADSSPMDFLYSMGRVSNPIIATMGQIIREAHFKRNKMMKDFSYRIMQATKELYNSGEKNTEFIYEDDNVHIISDIDWQAYKRDRKTAIKGFYAKGLRGFDLTTAVQDWEEQNTEERVVDSVSGRTERVPNNNYYKPMRHLNRAQQKYYDTIMQIKGEIGTLLPAYAQKQFLAPQVRRNSVDAAAKGQVVKGVKNWFKRKFTVTEDDTNYATNGIIDGDEYKIVGGGYDNTPLRQIPIYFINKLADPSEIMKDFSGALSRLTATAVNYSTINEIQDVVLFMGDFVKNQKAKPPVNEAEAITSSGVRLVRDLRRRSSNWCSEKLVDGFIDQFIYGEKRKLLFGSKSLDKVIDNLIQYTSFKGLTTNAKGAMSNALMGELQMFIEAGCHEFFGMRALARAHAILLGSNGQIWDALNETAGSKSKLITDRFDPEGENFGTMGHMRYHKSMFRKIMAHDFSYLGYGAGEFAIHQINMYAVLCSTKVKRYGRVTNLYDMLTTTKKENGVAKLILKDGVTDMDGNDITEEFLDNVMKRVKYVNDHCHGSMTEEDRGLIYQYCFGRAAMNFRQWMVEHYSRRFRGLHYDYTLGEQREGFWVSVYKMIESDKTKEARKQGEVFKALGLFTKDFLTFATRARSSWHNLNDMQKYNVKRACTEVSTLIALWGLSFVLGEPDDHKREFWRRWWIYQTKRLILDTEASIPNLSMFNNFIKLLQSPFASAQTISSLLYVFIGLENGDLTDKVKSGKHKGENVYWKNFKRYVLPFYKDFEQMDNFDTDNSLFAIFKDTPTGR